MSNFVQVLQSGKRARISVIYLFRYSGKLWPYRVCYANVTSDTDM